MTRVLASWVRREPDSGTFVIDAAPDDIGWHEVYDAIRAADAFAEVDEDSIEWDIDDD